jgi:hypothetical protein
VGFGSGWGLVRGLKQEEAKVVAVPIGFLKFSKHSLFAFWANAILHCPFARACPAQMGPVPTLCVCVCAATLDFYFTCFANIAGMHFNTVIFFQFFLLSYHERENILLFKNQTIKYPLMLADDKII